MLDTSLSGDTAYMDAHGADLIPDPTTAGDFCRRFDESDVLALMEAINAVRPKLWTGRGAHLLEKIAYIDVDGTMAPTTGGHKAGMDISYKGIGGYHPLIVSLANIKEVLYVVNRPGNQPSHAGAADWIDRAIDLVEPHAERICARGDTDLSLTVNFDRWAERVDFIFGMDCNDTMRRHAEALDEAAWSRSQRPVAYQPITDQTRRREPDHKTAIVHERGYVNLELNFEDVADFDYQPRKCARPYRVIALRKNISKSRGEQVLRRGHRPNVAPHCVILERRGIFHGRDGALELARLLEEELPDSPYVYTNRRIAFLEWTAEADSTRVRDGADSFLIEDGWIVARTIHYTLETVQSS